MADEVDPRLEADAQIARALEIVANASTTIRAGEVIDQQRDYTPDELETLFFALGTAMTQLAKLPGGKEARERFYHNARDILAQRGREDILAALDDDKARHDEAKKMVRRAFGDNVDLSPGTSGYAMVKVVEIELQDLANLREKMMTLVDSFALDTTNDLDKLIR